MRKPYIRLMMLFLLISLACSYPAMVTTQTTDVPQAVSEILISAPPGSTPTPTPFQPMGPTATTQVTATAVVEVVSSATPDPDTIGIPGVATPLPDNQKVPEGTINWMVLGNDYRPGGGYRTDIMMLVSINTKKGTVNVVSFPRDLYVTIPGWMTQRMNTAFPHGGFSMLADTMEANFGVRPTHYIMTNFQGFVGIINSLGGVNVNVGRSLSDSCDLPQSRGGYCSVSPGVVTMDGATALWYVRSRHTSNDLDRNRRQQEVMYAIFSKLMSLDAMTRLPELYNSYKSSVETDLSVGDLLPMLPVASQVIGDSSRIQRFTFGSAEVTNYITDGGAMVLLPNYDAIKKIINQAVFTP